MNEFSLKLIELKLKYERAVEEGNHLEALHYLNLLDVVHLSELQKENKKLYDEIKDKKEKD